MSWYDPSSWDLGDVERVGLGVATGGLSETGVGGRLIGTKSSKADSLAEYAAGAMDQSNTNAQNAYNLALQQAASAGLIQAPPQVSATQVGVPIIQAGTADQGLAIADRTGPARAVSAAGQMQGYNVATAKAANAADNITGYDAALAQAAKINMATSANMADVNTTVTAPELAPAAQTALMDVDRSNVASTGVNELSVLGRDEQLAAARAIAGGPSASAAQFKAGMDQATSDALSVAAQARGADRAGARREAIIQLGQTGAKAAEGAAATAAQEEVAKRTAYSSALQGVRGADVSVSQTQAQIDSQRAQTQANIDSQRATVKAQLNAAIAQGNTASVNDFSKLDAQLDLDAKKATVQAGLQQQSTGANLSLYNAKAANDINVRNSELETQTSITNAEARNKAASELAAAKAAAEREAAGSSTTVSLANSAAQTKAAADLAAANNSAYQNYANAATGVNTTNAQIEAARAEGNAARSTTIGTTNAGNQTQAAVAQGQAELQAGTSNASNALQAGQINTNAALDTEKIKQAGVTAGISGANTAAATQGGNAGAIIGAQKTAADAEQKKDAALVGAAGSAAAAMSDKRAKTDIHKPSDAAVDDLADRLSAYTWRYKPGYEDSGYGEHGGVMAQEVEKSPLGRKFVSEDSEGTKHVDVLSLAGLMASAAARSLRKTKGRASA